MLIELNDNKILRKLIIKLESIKVYLKVYLKVT